MGCLVALLLVLVAVLLLKLAFVFLAVAFSVPLWACLIGAAVLVLLLLGSVGASSEGEAGSSNAPEVRKPLRCKAITKAGKHCGAPVMANGLCRAHGGQKTRSGTP